MTETKERSLNERPPSPASDPPAGDEQHDTGGARNNTMLGMNVGYAGLMSGKKAWQLVGGETEIKAGSDQEQDADKHKNDFYGPTLA